MTIPSLAEAHGFGRLYNLPVPFWLYAWGAAAALLASFLVVGYSSTSATSLQAARPRELGAARWLAPRSLAVPARSPWRRRELENSNFAGESG